MVASQLTIIEWFMLAHHELLLFTVAFLVPGIVDELAFDLTYLALWSRGRVKALSLDSEWQALQPLSGRAAVFIPAFQESAVINSTITHALAAWPQPDMVVYVGCYRNDPLTIAEVEAIASTTDRVRLVINDRDGPTTKAQCLNTIYAALLEDEQQGGEAFHMVLLHDAEDMVDPAALPLLDRAMHQADFVQLPVLALPNTASPWIAGHYVDEFSEAHAKELAVRDALGCAIPGAGVGCAVSRTMLGRLADESDGLPFAEASLTEDYELGMRIVKLGGRGRFVRARTAEGRLVATRAYFPDQIETAVRQKTRWVHGICLQGWDRLGWAGGPVQWWMMLRDRRGPLNAAVLFCAYWLVLFSGLLFAAHQLGLAPPIKMSPLLQTLLLITNVGLVWRLVVRGIFTAREHGAVQGLFAIPRAVVSNIIAIMAGRRAFTAYLGTLRGKAISWDKTEHRDHPAMAAAQVRD